MKKSCRLLILLFVFLNVNLFYAFTISNKDEFVIGTSNIRGNLVNTTVSVEKTYMGFTFKNSGAAYFCSSIATAPPTVTSPVYLCKNSATGPLRATASAGGTLNWYGTNASGGTASLTAPTPSTSTVGTTSYYVSQTIGLVESTRYKIDVNVVADNGAVILLFRCDPSQIAAADKASSVFFDWGNNPLTPNSIYNYTYTIQGGSAVTASTSLSHVQVFGMVPGQSATLTITSLVQYPCVPPQKMTCSVPCGASTVTPIFTSIPTSYCINEVTTNLPTSSTNTPAITGTWSAPKVITTTVGTTNYVFTPNPVMFPCALTKTLTVKVGPVEPNFSDFSICSGRPAPTLNATSPNGITGTWSPPAIDNTNSKAYVFTPNPGQACAPTTKTINITVNPSNAIVNIDWTVTDAFSENQIVTVTAPVGVDYLYQLDDGPFQETPIFEYVSLGTHSITVVNKNGCSSLTVNDVVVINYPKYFTPNDDGFHDTWNIFSLENQSNFRILIFDRYGKFLKEIRPKSSGWDGMYNGHPMPANDYWFSVEYAEQNISKIFKSHFSLKR